MSKSITRLLFRVKIYYSAVGITFLVTLLFVNILKNTGHFHNDYNLIYAGGVFYLFGAFKKRNKRLIDEEIISHPLNKEFTFFKH